MICKKTGITTEAVFISRHCEFFAEQLTAQTINVEMLEPALTELSLYPMPHLHESWELKLFIGSGSVPLPEKKIEISLPGLIMVPPRTEHSGAIIKKNSKIRMLAISQEQNGLLLSYDAGDRQCHFILGQPRLAHLSALIFASPEKIYASIHSSLTSSSDKTAKSYAVNLLRFFLSAIARELLHQSSSQDLGLSPPDTVTRALQYMTVYYYMPALTVRKIAEHAGISPEHLSVLFRRREKTTVRKRLVEIRLTRARELLLSGRYSVKEASCLTGWNDQLYFSKTFKKYYGVCPKNISSISKA